jgi:hypothetical protein
VLLGVLGTTCKRELRATGRRVCQERLIGARECSAGRLKSVHALEGGVGHDFEEHRIVQHGVLEEV